MIYIGPYVFEVYEGRNKLLKLRAISDEEMGPYRTDPNGPKGFSYSPAIAEVYRNSVKEDLTTIAMKISNENCFMATKTLVSLESLAKVYEFKALMAWFERYWQEREDIAQANNLYAEAKNRANTDHETMKLIRAFKDEIELTDAGPEMRMARVKYLEAQNRNLSSVLKKMEARFNLMEFQDVDKWLIDLAKDMSGYEKMAGKVRSNKITIAHLMGKYSNKKTVVTDDMIKLAKKVPFDKLLKLEQVGSMKRCKCPFHNEKTASFYVYPDTNRGHCHGCGKNVDTIQYLVEVNKVEFNEAVLMLLSY